MKRSPSKRIVVTVLQCVLLCFSTTHAFSSGKQETPLQLGIERIADYADLFDGKRVGLITNQTGINAQGVSSITLLQRECNLVSLFSPEHGLGGYAREGAFIENETEASSGLTVYSLYGEHKRPNKKQLEAIDVLCFDIQDVGARFYTYISTMAYAMEACARNNKEFVVFDRPNPIGDSVEGNILEDDYRSFTGYFPIVQRHGMTVGELARFFNAYYKIACKLTVVPMKGWKRDSYFDDLPLIWIPPSPNIPTPQSALVYSGMCLFEGCNVSVGRGTTKPFEYLGAPFIDSQELARYLNKLKLDGVRFVPVSFEPSQSLYKGEVCNGIFIAITNRKTFKAMKTAVQIFYSLQELYPDDFKIKYKNRKYSGLNLLMGCACLTDGHTRPRDYFQRLKVDSQRFKEIRKPYLLY